MAQSGRPLYMRVGVLVLVGLALAVGFVLFLTSGALRGQQVLLETYIQESVAGLDVGSPVRFRGVAIGRVTELGLVSVAYPGVTRTPDDPAGRLVLVRFAVDPERYGSAPLTNAVRAGLRVRLTSAGVTGLTYIEVDFVDVERFPAMEPPWRPRYTFVPSIPSTITQVTSAAERLMTQLAGLDLDRLADTAVGVLEDLRRQLSGRGDLGVALHEAALTLTAVREAVQGSEIPATLRVIREAAGNVGGAGARLEQLLTGPEVSGALVSVEQAANDLRTGIARLPAVIQSLELALRSVRGTTNDVQSDLGPLLRDLRATVSSLRDTAEALRRNPSQTLFGAPPPPPRDRR